MQINNIVNKFTHEQAQLIKTELMLWKKELGKTLFFKIQEKIYKNEYLKTT